MKIELQVRFDDGSEKRIICGAADMIAFEEKFDKSVMSLAKDPRLTHMIYLGWHSEQRTKSTALSFEEWAATISDIGEAEDPKS